MNRSQFTVTIGTVMEDTKIPLSKWLFAMHLLGASKKGMSALQLSRMLGVTYKSAWFLCHRIRGRISRSERISALAQEEQVDGVTPIRLFAILGRQPT